ncbi:MAG: sulfatase-like hydrolase/transferase, partial [Candidatus Binatia bacterium]
MGRRHRTPILLLLAVISFIAFVYFARFDRRYSAVEAGAPGARGLRVVLVTLDTLRFDSFRGGDGRSSQMPMMAARAARGAVWDRCFSSTSSTQPTHATLFTGLHPWQHGVSRNGQILDARHRTVAEVFRHAGFHTVAVVGSFPVTRHFGFGKGFDEFDDSLDRGSPGPVFDVDPEEQRHYRLADAVTSAAVARLAGDTARRQFYWVH